MIIAIASGKGGIGCPVIGSLTGIDLAGIVTESMPSGGHDLERTADPCVRFRRPAAVVLNKADIGDVAAGTVRAACRSRGLPIVAEVPYDLAVIDAMIAGRVMTETAAERVAAPLCAAWDTVLRLTAARRAA